MAIWATMTLLKVTPSLNDIASTLHGWIKRHLLQTVIATIFILCGSFGGGASFISTISAAEPTQSEAEPTPVATDLPPSLESLEPVTQLQYQFAQTMELSLTVRNDPPLQSATLVLNFSLLPLPFVKEFPVEAGSGDVITFRNQLDLQTINIIPFDRATYSWRLVTSSGQEIQLPSETFLYIDNRFTWQETAVQDGSLAVYVSEETPQLGQIGLSVAATYLPELELVIPSQPTPQEPLLIYLYPSAQAYQEAFRLAQVPWSDGHTAPELGVVLLPIGNVNTAQIDLRRQLPHELSHILLYRATTPYYNDIPRWFDEGLATLFEDPPNVNYQVEVDRMISSNQLIPFDVITPDFPRSSPEMALQAYAQSHGFMAYLQSQFGNDVITSIISALGKGIPFEAAIEQIFSVSMEELTFAWLATTQPIWYRIDQGLLWLIGAVLASGFLILAVVWIRADGTEE